MIIDSQTHLWEASRPDRPWPTDRNTGTQRAEPLEPPEMLAQMDAIGVDRLVIVPPIWVGEKNESPLEWAAEYPDRFAVMGRFDLWAPDARDQLAHWLEQPGMLGIRMSYPTERGDDWFDPATFPWFWEGAEEKQMPVMILSMGAAGKARRIIEQHPGIPVILDHLALAPAPQDAPDREAITFGDNFTEVLSFAEHPNVSVKFSALPLFSSEVFPYPKMTPHLKRAFDAYGPERIMWGSDFTLITRSGRHTYKNCLDHLVGLEFLSDDDRAWILAKTAANVLGWPFDEGS